MRFYSIACTFDVHIPNNTDTDASHWPKDSNFSRKSFALTFNDGGRNRHAGVRESWCIDADVYIRLTCQEIGLSSGRFGLSHL